MDLYPIVKFLHLGALLVAAAVTAVTKLAATRRIRARTVGEALEWHNVLMGAAKLFPICLVVFVVTGGYMLSVVRVSMATGFIVAGLVGVVLLLASGLYLASKGKALAFVLEGIAAQGADQPAPKLAPPPLVVMLPTVNTGIAVSVAFAMVLKPTSIPIALVIVAVGIVLGVLAAPKRPTGARAPIAVSEG